MISASYFSPVTIQVAVWLPNPDTFSQSRFLGTVLGKYSDRYDNDPIISSLPADAPIEIPRIGLSSKDDQWTMHAGPLRIDAFWLKPVSELGNSTDETILSRTLEGTIEYLKALDIAVTRIGIVVSRIYPADDAVQQLIDYFSNETIKKGPLINSEVFEIHNQTSYVLPSMGVEVTRWIRCRAGDVQAVELPAITFEQDINIPETENLMRFDSNEVTRFTQECWDEMTSVLNLYFPERE